VDPISTMALAAGLSWASGLRLYAVLFTAGALHALGAVDLPDGLEMLSHPLVLGVSGVLLFIEFFADKIPGIDSLWDAVQTFVRIPAGALLAVGALGPPDTAGAIAAALLGGTLAGGTHFTKAGGRVLINASPEPVSNWTASFGEDVAALGAVWIAFKYPLLLIALVAIFLVLVIWWLPKLLRAIAAFVRRIAAMLRRDGRSPAASAKALSSPER